MTIAEAIGMLVGVILWALCAWLVWPHYYAWLFITLAALVFAGSAHKLFSK